MAGYSGTPLPKKLGLPVQGSVVFIDEPAHFRRLLGAALDSLTVSGRVAAGSRYVHVFAKNAAVLTRKFAAAAQKLDKAGMLWVSWPKKTSGVATDLSEDVVRRIGLEAGLVDVKVCAVDETWSGLKFMVRLRDRQRQ